MRSVENLSQLLQSCQKHGPTRSSVKSMPVVVSCPVHTVPYDWTKTVEFRHVERCELSLRQSAIVCGDLERSGQFVVHRIVPYWLHCCIRDLHGNVHGGNFAGNPPEWVLREYRGDEIMKCLRPKYCMRNMCFFVFLVVFSLFSCIPFYRCWWIKTNI